MEKRWVEKGITRVMAQYGKTSNEPISQQDMDTLVEEIYERYHSGEEGTLDDWLHDVVYGFLTD